MALVIKKAVKGVPLVIEFPSLSTPGVYYQIDRVMRTCSCESFAQTGNCKHLEIVGAYPVKEWTGKTHPTFSQALSGLVKSIRLRNIREAVYWLVYLNNIKEKGARFRIARRLLIGSAEDGMSVAVMERVSRNFSHLCQEDTNLMELVAEVVRICKVPNWWHPSTNGPSYIRAGNPAYRRLHFLKEGTMDFQYHLAGVREAIQSRDTAEALFHGMCLPEVKGANRTMVATQLQLIAFEENNPMAHRLLEIHLNNKSALSGDENFILQSIWWMCLNISPMGNTIETVLAGEVREHIQQAQEDWKSPHLIPGWCCDGVHCGGADRRFAGFWADMTAVCNAYDHYGVVDPSMQWKVEFYDLAGLKFKQMI